MISHEYKCIFIHQRKCAGISILQTFGFDDPTIPDWHFMNDGVLCPEYYARPLDYFRFTVVRNPWDRFVSGWLYCEETRDRPLRDLLQDLPKIGHDYTHITRLQRDILFDQSGFLVVEKLMRFENLQKDFDEVCDTIGKPHTTLPRLNQQIHRPYQEYFEDPIDKNLFLRHFGRDVNAFEYEF